MGKGVFYDCIACMSGPAPSRAIARFMLYANTCKLISVRTFSSALI